MRVWMIIAIVALAGCTDEGADHDHSDRDANGGDGHTGPLLEIEADEARDRLVVTKAVAVDWGKTTADLSDGCSARLETEAMGADVKDGQPLMSHRHDAVAGDHIAIEGAGTCTISLHHDGTALGTYTITIG